jgi:hypothetical protein
MNILDSIISSFKYMVYEQNMNKSAALDILCEDFSHRCDLNPVWIRSVIRGADGWYY